MAGAWTFSYSHPQRHSSLPFDETPADPPGSIRIRLVYLEDDPADVTPAAPRGRGRLPRGGGADAVHPGQDDHPLAGLVSEALERRLQVLEDRAEIADLIARYGPAADSGDADAVAALWGTGRHLSVR